MTADRWADLGLNLLAEAIGILITVIWVDSIIKKRERERWKPAKNVVYYRLTELVWQVFVYFSPLSLYKGSESVVISFGKIDTGTVKDISSLDLGMSVLGPLLKEEWANQELGPWLVEQRMYMTEIKKTIDGIVNDATVFLEPEVLSLVLLLREEVDNFFLFLSNLLFVTDETEETHLLNWASFHTVITLAWHLLTAAQNLEKWLIKQSTRKRTLEEAYGHIIEEVDETVKILEKQK